MGTSSIRHSGSGFPLAPTLAGFNVEPACRGNATVRRALVPSIPLERAQREVGASILSAEWTHETTAEISPKFLESRSISSHQVFFS